MAPTRTLQSIVGSEPDLGPLVANSTYRKAVEAELATIDAAAEYAQLQAAANEDLAGTVTMFSGAMRNLRAIAKRYPETAQYVNEAIKQTQLAMTACHYNPVAPVAKAAAAIPPSPSSTTTTGPQWLPHQAQHPVVPERSAPPATPTSSTTYYEEEPR